MVSYHPDGSRTVPLDILGAPASTQVWRNKSDKRLYLDSTKTRVVEEGDEDAAFLLASAGGTIPMIDAARYGLIDEGVEAFLPPAVVDSMHEMYDNNLKAASQKLRHQAFVAGDVVDAEEGLAKAEDKVFPDGTILNNDAAAAVREDNKAVPLQDDGTTIDDAPNTDGSSTDSKSVKANETRDKAVAGPATTKDK